MAMGLAHDLIFVAERMVHFGNCPNAPTKLKPVLDVLAVGSISPP